MFVSEGHQLWVDTHQSAQQFTAKGCAAAVFHGKSHLVDELLHPIHALQGLTGHLAGSDTHTHVIRALAELFIYFFVVGRRTSLKVPYYTNCSFFIRSKAAQKLILRKTL